MADRVHSTRRSSVLLFDLGGVLVHTKGFESLKGLLTQGGRPEAIDDQLLRDRWLASTSVRDFELGRISPPEFASAFVKEWQLATSPDALLDDLATWVEGPYPGTERLLTTLRQHHLVCCFSNCNALHWAVMAPLMQHFDHSFSSHLLGHIKPDESAFLAVLESVGAEPEAVRFFDDSRTNVAGAQKVGIKAFLVGGPSELRLALHGEGLL